MATDPPRCARCPLAPDQRLCRTENGKAPGFCPTRNMPDLTRQSLDIYADAPGVGEFAHQASVQEAEGYMHRERGYEKARGCNTRIEEIMAFSQKMSYRRLGLAFCMGLRNEAAAVERIFTSRGFAVVSVVCKTGGVSKEHIGIDRSRQIDPGAPETMCNPVLQALVLNRAETDFNVLLGLCVGHDSLFFKYAAAPCTVLAVKDRVLGHNPLAAVYTLDSYYRSLK